MAQDAEPINIGQKLKDRLAELDLTIEQSTDTPQTQVFSDLRGNTWRTNACTPSRSFAGHTVVHIATDDDGSVRVYAAPIIRDDMTAAEKKSAQQHGGIFLLFKMRVDVPSLLLQVFDNADNFVGAVAQEIRSSYDDFVDKIDQATEADLVVDYLRGLPAGTTLAQAIADLDANKHLEEGEEPEETPTNGASASSAPVSPPVAS